jgi:cation transport ATPase
VFDYACFILEQVEDAQAREAPVQRLADSIAGPFVYTVMTLAAATFSFWCALTFIFFYSMIHENLVVTSKYCFSNPLPP